MLKSRALLKRAKTVFPQRFFHDKDKELITQSSLKVKNEEESWLQRNEQFGGIEVKYWRERVAVRREKKKNKFPKSIKSEVDLIKFCHSLNNFPSSFSDAVALFKKRKEKFELVSQAFLPQRVEVLKPDLAAAHFIVYRGGSVKFLGKPEWIGMREEKKLLPVSYVPGLFVEGIKAEGTNLLFEGLPNLRKLNHLSYLSLRNLETINDWCMDWISNEFSTNLKHLDLSGCKNVTYRGLSCFYRFECLEKLDVKGIPDTPEFKVACLMLLDIMPNLDIIGIDLNIPEEIDGDISKAKHIPEPNKLVEEGKS